MGKRVTTNTGVPSTLRRDCPERGADNSGDEHPWGVGVDIEPWHDPRRLGTNPMPLSPHGLTSGWGPQWGPPPQVGLETRNIQPMT